VPQPTLTLCRSCRSADLALPVRLTEALKQAGIAARVQEVDCMSGCTRPQTLAVRQSGKTAYLFGEITAADLPDIVVFLRLFNESADGTLADARPLGALRMKAIARIPADLD
jgi:predicted metal-binding protein